LRFSRKHQDGSAPILFFQDLRENTVLFITSCIEKHCTRPLKEWTKQQQVPHNSQSVFRFMLIHVQLQLSASRAQTKTSYRLLTELVLKYFWL